MHDAGGHDTGARRASGEAPRRHSLLPSRRRIKHVLSKRLTYSPFLKMLLLYFWFRIAILALVVIGLTTAVMLPRLWTTTPPGFMPPVKVSLLDKMQAYMLRRAADKATARGDSQTAIEAWLNALGNNMGNPNSARGLLRTALVMDPIPAKNLGPAIQTGDWLLRLTGTNRADLELVSAFLDKVQFYALAKAQLEPFAKGLSGNIKAIYLKSVFFEGELDSFNQLWQELSPEEQARPDLALIRAAYLAGWGDVGTVAEARQLLGQAAETRGPLWSLANRLVMAVSAVRIDPEGYVEALNRLQQVQQDSAADNASYWELLATAGRRAEAVRLARDFVSPPRDSYELIRMTEASLALGLDDEALKRMHAFAKYYPFSEQVWTTYAKMLFDAKDWERLRGAALQMRQVSVFRGRLDALSLFYEGRADLATARLEAARRAFDAATNADFQAPDETILAVNSLLSLGYPVHARAVLERAEGVVTNRVQYLDLLSRAAIQSRDEALMLSACQAAYELQPSSIDSAHRYAAALLIRAEHPEQAVRLTMELNLRFPNSNALRINHALALLLNRRADDAEAVLNELPFARLRPDEVNSYYQAMFELKSLRQDYSSAWRALDRIDWSLLFPSETNRLGKIRTALPPRPVSPSGSPSA
jgi:hypothetical protein